MTHVDEYFDAEGIIHRHPSVESVINSVEGGSQSNWEAGSGQAALYWREGQAENSLVLTPGGDSHYFVQYFSSSMTEGHLMSLGKTDDPGNTDVSVGGDPWLVPTKLFVGKPSVVDAVRDFYHDGKASKHINWVRDNEVAWPDQE